MHISDFKLHHNTNTHLMRITYVLHVEYRSLIHAGTRQIKLPAKYDYEKSSI